jgi:hypothetical protein
MEIFIILSALFVLISLGVLILAYIGTDKLVWRYYIKTIKKNSKDLITPYPYTVIFRNINPSPPYEYMDSNNYHPDNVEKGYGVYINLHFKRITNGELNPKGAIMHSIQRYNIYNKHNAIALNVMPANLTYINTSVFLYAPKTFDSETALIKLFSMTGGENVVLGNKKYGVLSLSSTETKESSIYIDLSKYCDIVFKTDPETGIMQWYVNKILVKQENMPLWYAQKEFTAVALIEPGKAYKKEMDKTDCLTIQFP